MKLRISPAQTGGATFEAGCSRLQVAKTAGKSLAALIRGVACGTASGVLLAAAIALLFQGCLVVPLPGMRSGRVIDEKVVSSLAAGTSRTEVVLQLGEPDAISPDGRQLAFRSARAWAAVIGQSSGKLLFAAEAVVFEFDDRDRLKRVTRREILANSPSMSDSDAFVVSKSVEGQRVLQQWVARWWIVPVETEVSTAPQLWLGSEMWVGVQPRSIPPTGQGRVLFTEKQLTLRPDGAKGGLNPGSVVVPLELVAGRALLDAGTKQARLVLLLKDRRCVAITLPASNRYGQFPGGWETAPAGAGPAPLAGWSVVAIRKGRLLWGQKRLGCLWLFDSGLSLEWERSGNPVLQREFIAWSRVAAIVPQSKFLSAVGAEVDLVDGTRLGFGVMAGRNPPEGYRDFPERLVEAWKRGTAQHPAGDPSAAEDAHERE